MLNSVESNLNSDSKLPLVLLIEDDVLVSDSLSEQLKANGFRVVSVENAKDAISKISEQSPDLILSDIWLPGKSGLDLFNEFRANPVWSQIPFIFISGDNNLETQRASLSLGGAYFVQKPFDIGELISAAKGQLIKIKSQEENKDQVIGAFKKRVVHTLSHEFRTPLVAITTGSELLLEEFDSLKNDQVKNLLVSILRGGQRLERLVEDFIVLQQIDIGEAKTGFDKFRSPCSVAEVFDLLSEEVNEKFSETYNDFLISYSCSEDLKKEVFNPFLSQLVDAIIRLIDNALKFSNDNKKEVNIDFLKEDKNLKIIIRDFGRGFEGESIKLMDEDKRFFQIKRDLHEQQGCGLGISIASHYIKYHSGTISFEKPEDGIGLLAVVLLPLN